MHRDLQRYLDGELPRDALAPELEPQAREWDALLRDAEVLRDETAPPWLETRVMASLPAAAPAPAWRRALTWLVQPHEIALRPVAVLAGAAAVVLGVVLWPRAAEKPAAVAQAPAAAPAAPSASNVIYVQFTLTAPGARSVEVAGDFNGWQPAHAELRDPEGDGTWSGLIALPTGVHKYMFVIDGRRWVSDPHAHRFVDDGFGMRNSLIAVVPPARSS